MPKRHWNIKILATLTATKINKKKHQWSTNWMADWSLICIRIVKLAIEYWLVGKKKKKKKKKIKFNENISHSN